MINTKNRKKEERGNEQINIKKGGRKRKRKRETSKERKRRKNKKKIIKNKSCLAKKQRACERR